MIANENNEDSAAATKRTGLIVRGAILAVLVGLVAWLYFSYRSEFSLDRLVEYESRLTSWRDGQPLPVYVLAFLFYVAVTGLSLPGATVLSLAYAWFFGFWPALLLVSFASTTGATVAFLMSRYLLRDLIESRFKKQMESFNKSLEKEGAFYLFSLRLVPLVPFFVINAVMGLTQIRVTTFWWVSQIGMLAGTILYIYTGSQFPTARELADHGISGILTWQLFVGFTLLGIFPIVVKKLVDRYRKKA